MKVFSLHHRLWQIEASNFREVAAMKVKSVFSGAIAFAMTVTLFAQNQPTPPSQPSENQTSTQQATAQPVKPTRSAKGDIGSGSGDIGKGAAKGTGDLAKGTGKGAVDLVTLHPIDAAGSVGKGAASAGKNVAVGTGKGTGKIVKGTGKAIKHVF
jgi:hypothetical protein